MNECNFQSKISKVITGKQTPWIIGFIGVIISVVIFFVDSADKYSDWYFIFKQDAMRRTAQFEKALEINEAILSDLAFILKNSNYESLGKIKPFVSQILKKFTIFESIAWAPKITIEERQEHEKNAGAALGVDYFIKDISANGVLVPAVTREVYFPIFYHEPSELKFLGYDLNGEKTRSDTIKKAINEGMVIATKKIKMYNGASHGIICFMPVFNSDSVPVNIIAREKQLKGVIYGAYFIDKFINNVVFQFVDRVPENLNFCIYLISEQNEKLSENLLYGRLMEDFPLYYEKRIKLYGQQWLFVWQGGKKYDDGPELMTSWLLGIGSFLLTILIVIIVKLLQNYVFAANEQINLKIKELSIANIELQGEIVERKKVEKELYEAKVQADSANKAKSLFLANMSHEIRTPLNSIIGFTEILGETEINREQKELLGYIATSSNGLLALINDILDFSKIEAGKLEVESIEFDIGHVVHEVVSIANAAAIEKRLELTYEIDDRIKKNVIGDPYRLKQIILNLVSNAIKFTDKGYVKIKCEQINEENDAINVKISVIDTGIGISENEQLKIFKPFVQADGTVARKFGGTGLGLAISTQLVKLMGGEQILLQSEKGRGSTFYFLIKFQFGSAIDNASENVSTPKENLTKSVKKINILLAEDNVLNVKLALQILNKRGHNVKVVNDGAQAVETCAKENFDLILMDVQMPVMDGIEATKKIRENGITVPIIAMTAAALKGDQEACINAGMTGYISKPIKIKELEKKICEVANNCKDSELEENLSNNEELTNSQKSISQEIGILALLPELENIKVIDFKYLLENMDNDVEIISEMIKIFIESSGEYVNEIEVSLATHDFDKIKKSVHKLKGSALNTGALTMAEILKKFEELCKQQDDSKFTVLFEALKSEFTKFKEEASKKYLK
ncbi:MAG: response regulator [Candidatus Wallbacteria bacterium]